MVERYFEVNRIPAVKRVDTTVVCLEGRALNLFQWWEPRVLMMIWPVF